MPPTTAKTKKKMDQQKYIEFHSSTKYISIISILVLGFVLFFLVPSSSTFYDKEKLFNTLDVEIIIKMSVRSNWNISNCVDSLRI